MTSSPLPAGFTSCTGSLDNTLGPRLRHHSGLSIWRPQQGSKKVARLQRVWDAWVGGGSVYGKVILISHRALYMMGQYNYGKST